MKEEIIKNDSMDCCRFYCFWICFFDKAIRLIKRTKQIVTISRHSIEAIRNSNLDDKQKEIALQQNGKHLFKLFLILAFGGATSILLPLDVVWLFDRIGLVSFRSVLDVTFSTVFIITSGVLFVLLFYISKINHKTNSYSFLDRFLHRLAFKTYIF